MSNYMPDTAGTGEDMPSGKIVILEDFDGDGRMDKRSVFMDSLVLPRAICLIDGGVLVAEPPNLWYVENNNGVAGRSEEHTSELQSLMRISYAVFCLKKKNTNN